MENTNKNRIRLVSMTLLESSFKRMRTLNDYDKSKTEISIKNNSGASDNFITIDLGVIVNQTYEESKFVEITATMAGVFEKTSDADAEFIKNFVEINGPAIIFPYLREVVSSLSVRGGVRPILIQPINFVNRAKTNGKK